MRHALIRVGGPVLAIVLFLMVGTAWQPAIASARHSAPPVRYYVALGDSLSRGVQPTSTAPGQVTNEGYVDDLYAYYRARVPGLQLEKLGCPGETTVSMINGHKCSYPSGSQLAEAVSFLQHHRVSLVTFDIGPNDVTFCLGAGTVEQISACVAHQVQQVIRPNLTYILTQLRHAGGDQAPIFAMNFYDPYLAAWLQNNQALARATVTFVQFLNTTEQQVYRDFHVRVANVEQAFETTNFTPTQSGLPVNVALICAWTWMCSRGDIHANAAGYAVIAATFERVIRGRVHSAAVGASEAH
jgi:lysophospholipase L1-like esterase